jgi:signal transduction histidine kinase
MELENLFHLYPFGLLLNLEGKISRLGKSTHKILKCSEGDPFINFCKNHKNESLKKLPDTYQLIWIKSDVESINIRGQLLPVEGGYFFTANVGFNKTEFLKNLNLTFQDFSLQENIFDFLMLLGTQERVIVQLQETLENLKNKNILSTFLNEIAVEFEKVSTSEDVFIICAKKLRDRFTNSEMISAKFRTSKNKEYDLEEQLTHCESVFGVDSNTGDVFLYEDEKKSSFLIKISPAFHVDFQDILMSGCSDSNCEVILKVKDTDHVFISFMTLNQKEFNLKKEENTIRILLSLLQAKVSALSSQKQAQEMMMQRAHLGRIALLGEISAAIAHEINNPLAIIGLMIDKLTNDLLETGEYDKFQKSFETIKNSIDRIVKIIHGLRAYARGGIGDSFVDVKLKSVIDDTLVLMQSKMKHKSVRLIKEIHNEELSLECIPVQIVQILSNLISNSVDATSGSANPTIRLISSSTSEWLKIEVRDSGPGIPDHIAEKLMTPFFTTKEPGKGTGLGLSLSQNIASHHHGKLYLDRSVPETCFVLEIPLRSPKPNR